MWLAGVNDPSKMQGNRYNIICASTTSRAASQLKSTYYRTHVHVADHSLLALAVSLLNMLAAPLSPSSPVLIIAHG
jgi:hypothetical protein